MAAGTVQGADTVLLMFVALVVLFIVVVRLASRISELEAREAAAAAERDLLGRKVDSLMKAGLTPAAPPQAPAAVRVAPPGPQIAAPAIAPPAFAPSPEVSRLPITVPPLPKPEATRPPPAAPPPLQPAVTREKVPTRNSAVEPEPALPATKPAFDWEELIGVRLFSWAAGVLLALAAVFFLGYSIQQGWLQPPVRMAIGVVVGAGLLALCEMKAARRYPVTANALDGSAIAILFATFFAAYRLWSLLGPAATFALMAAVTTVAVLLSIRRDSVFIALLGLVGGFATPALLSTGEDNPFGLFGYLLLLNAGLGWVAYRKRWPVLVALSVILTTGYQWGWVATFLAPGKLPVASAIFLAFPILGLALLGLAGRTGALETSAGDERRTWFEELAGLNAALPLLFAVFLAASRTYGQQAAMMFGFLFCVDAGLFAVALWRRRPLLHVLGGIATLVVFAAWLSTLYGGLTASGETPAGGTHYPASVGYVAVFVALYLAAGLAARRGRRQLDGVGRLAVYAAPLLLFVFPTVAAAEAAAASPYLPFGVLFVLLVGCAAYAVAEGDGLVYYIGAFLTVAAEASWSARHVSGETLWQAVAIYGLFGLLFVGVPLAARRLARPLEPAWLGGSLIVASIALLFFLSSDAVAAESLWGLALLLGVLNVALLVESSAARLPALALVGETLSWLAIAAWCGAGALANQAVAAVAVVTGFALLTLGGQLWAGRADAGSDDTQQRAALALAAHVLLLFMGITQSPAVPMWALLAALAVLDTAVAAAALGTRRAELLAGAVGLSQIDLIAWASAGSLAASPLLSLLAGTAVAALGLGCAAMATRRTDNEEARRNFGMSAVAGLTLGQVLLIVVGQGSEPPSAIVLAAFHLFFLVALLWLAATRGWLILSITAVALTTVATWGWRAAHWGVDGLSAVMTLAAPIYLVFMAYPLMLGRRVGREWWPHLAAVLASASFFHVGRSSLVAAGHQDVIGALPLAQAALMGLVLRGLLAIEPPGSRMLGRLALVAGAALAFVTVAIPLQLEKQWITIGWALEGAALAWLYRRIPHRGLLWSGLGLLAAVFVRLALNPEVLVYHARSDTPILNWYLYTYLVCAVAMLAAGWLFTPTDDALGAGLRASQAAPAAGTILLFLLLNIEIADFFATGDRIRFNLSAGLGQNLTYTLGWAVFAVGLLAVGIALRSHAARLAAIVLLTVAALKGFLSDVSRLPGLYRVMSLVGLAVCLALVAVALQRFVLAPGKADRRNTGP